MTIDRVVRTVERLSEERGASVTQRRCIDFLESRGFIEAAAILAVHEFPPVADALQRAGHSVNPGVTHGTR